MIFVKKIVHILLTEPRCDPLEADIRWYPVQTFSCSTRCGQPLVPTASKGAPDPVVWPGQVYQGITYLGQDRTFIFGRLGFRWYRVKKTGKLA